MVRNDTMKCNIVNLQVLQKSVRLNLNFTVIHYFLSDTELNSNITYI